MANQYHHLSLAERYVIDKLFNRQASIRGIALVLERSPSTISEEIKRNLVNGRYVAEKAKHKAYVKRKYSKAQCLKVAMDDFLYRFVLEKLAKKWSPEQMSGYLARQGIKVSTKAIYKFIYRRGFDYLLFWSWNQKKSGRKQYHYGQAPDGRKYIEERPSVNGRGHYELDFIVSKQSTWVLMVAVDRHQKKTWVVKLSNRKRDTVRVALQRLFHGIDLKSITTSFEDI